ncbi:MAG TPA: aminotransferase class I/II-fold pyridoxal phosphate-dependent enzyme, partial [Flavobacteriales bacterium]|nr:aminotransferase class I/II-fold pyridoxal phosphate-dependent enzyme [Flavobacteriales bacterium]
RGLAKYLSTEHSREHLRNVGPIYERKRNRLLEGLKGTAFRFTPAEGGYFQVLDYSQLKTLGDKPDIDVARELTINHGLATIPLSPFRESQSESALSERRLRICFAKGDDTIDATIEKLVAIDKFYKDV